MIKIWVKTHRNKKIIQNEIVHYEGKYEEEGRVGKVRVDYPFTYCKPEDIVDDTRNRNPCFSMYKRKK